MSTRLPADPGELLRSLDARAIDRWLDGIDPQDITQHVLDLDAQIRSWKVLAKAVRTRQRRHLRNIPCLLNTALEMEVSACARPRAAALARLLS
jgi:hypothetical protein